MKNEKLSARSPEEIQRAIDDLHAMAAFAHPETDKMRWEMNGVMAALKWALGGTGGNLEQNLRDIRHVLAARKGLSN